MIDRNMLKFDLIVDALPFKRQGFSLCAYASWEIRFSADLSA